MQQRRQLRPLRYFFSALLALCSSGPVSASNLDAIQRLVDDGYYLRARAAIHEILGAEPDEALRQQLLFEMERMRRIEMEFTLKRTDLLTSIQRYIADATETDVSQWDQQGLLESMTIEGERRFFAKTAYNLMHISREAAERSEDHRRFTDKAPLYQLHPHHQEIVAKEQPVRQRIRITYTLTVDADAVDAGETLHAWLPFPQEIPGRQENIQLLNSTPSTFELAPPTQSQRTVYFEKPAAKGQPTEFEVSYEFDSVSSYTPINPAEVKSQVAAPALAPYLAERTPHVQFTPELRALSERVVAGETNPYRVAQKLFAYVDQIPWAGAREYSTIRNISEYAATAGHADCGQQTLLLITLLRMNGIPARWQSGWEFSPETFDTMHDWGEFYLAPYGWMPMDVTHGLLDGKTEAERWFYLGGLDAYRLIFNTDYSQPFHPAKQHFRSETVDSQRGEVEWRGGNLYFDQWDYHMEWELLETGGSNLLSEAAL